MTLGAQLSLACILAGCTPLATVGLGTDAFGPPAGHVRGTLGGLQGLSSPVDASQLFGGGTAEVPHGSRASSLFLVGAGSTDPVFMVRVSERYRFTPDDERVAAAVIGGFSVVGDEVAVGPFAGAVLTLRVAGGSRISVGGTLGGAYDGDTWTAPQLQAALRWSTTVTPHFEIDGEAGLLTLGEAGSQPVGGVILGFTAVVPTRRCDHFPHDDDP